MGLPTSSFILCVSRNSTRHLRIGCAPQLVSVVTCLYMAPVTSDIVGSPQALGSPICLVDVADSLSFHQVLSLRPYFRPLTCADEKPGRLFLISCQACWHMVQPTAFYKSTLMGKYTNDKHACIDAQLLACTLL